MQDQKTELKKSLEKTVATLAEVLEEKVALQRLVYEMKDEIIRLNDRLIKQHNVLCEHGLEEHGGL